MKIYLASKKECSGCGACAAACPKDALSMIPDCEGFLRPNLDKKRCIHCGACSRACPVLGPIVLNPTTPTCYAARTRDSALRIASSSGGIFTELAKPILSSGGVVFGCVWERPTFVAIHAKAETLDELAAMRGSKYVQSDTRDTYRQVRDLLRLGRSVLYTGTPCQIAGLKRFLGQSASSELLTTLEIICHGGPSPAIWKKYKEEVVSLHQASLKRVSFRDKFYSWRRFSLLFDFESAGEARADLFADPYLHIFLKDLILRPSCYACKAREARSGADITIADFWGIERVCQTLDDNRGTSAILIHSDRGAKLLQMISPALEICRVSYDQVLAGNRSFVTSVKYRSKRRSYIRRALKSRSLIEFINRVPFPKRIVNSIRSFFRNMRSPR